MTYTFSIKMHTYWHCGSGLAAGADVDLLVIKDKDGFPFVPGKTIKGLFREYVEEILTLSGENEKKNQDFVDTFGYLDEDNKEKESTVMAKAKTFFSNAELSPSERNAIKSKKLTKYLYKSVSNTAIDADGIVKEHSLRKTEVVVPCTLHGQITDLPEGFVDIMKEAAGFIKNLGTGRNRGLGRCTVELRKEDII